MRQFWAGAVLSLVLSTAISGTAAASPWAEAGDRQLRNDIELLARNGLVRGPITAWPIPWKQITSRLSVDYSRDLPPHVQRALDRVQAKMPREEDFGRPKLGVEARGTNRAKIGRDFGDAARDKADVAASAEINWGATSARLKVGYQGDDTGDNLTLDGSYAAVALGNWALYGGWLDHWWGPAWSSSTIVSSNSRPMPRAGLMRLDPRPFETPWLSWLGPWQFNVFLGLLDDDEQTYSNPYYVGMRLTFNPIQNLEIGLSRTIMICGARRPCDLKTWGKALVGGFNLDNPMNPDQQDPSNQLAGFDIRYAFALSDTLNMAVYGQMTGEDEKDFYPFKFGGVAGVSLDGPWGEDGAAWRIIAEYSDTVAFLSPGRQYNVMYNHSRYASGYRYQGDSMGDRWDSDSKAIYLSGLFTDKDGWTYRLGYQRARINVDNAGINHVSTNYEKINIFETGVEALTPIGIIGVELRYQDDKPNTPGRKDGAAAIEVGWSKPF